MPRTLSLTPKFVNGRKLPWQVWIPAYLSETGKPKRLYYQTKREAQTAADLIRVRSENYGRSAMAISPTQISIAAEAFRMLGDRPDVALLEVVQVGLAHEQRRKASVPWSTLITEFLATKQNRSVKHRKSLRLTQRKFNHLDARMVTDITDDRLAEVLSPLPPSARNLEIRLLRSIFTYGQKRGWTDANPANQLDFAEIVRGEVEVFSAHEVESLLNHALHHDPVLLPFFALTFFAGIRGEGEISKLQWNHVHFTGAKPEVEVPPSASKTRKRRFVDLAPNAIQWLDAYRRIGGNTEGPIISCTPVVLSQKRRRAAKAVGVRWIQSGPRHTFCSAWLAKHRDVNRLVLMSGHDSADTMFRHYHRGMTEAEAERFWAIVPPEGQLSKVVPFKSIA
jgi:integrase